MNITTPKRGRGRPRKAKLSMDEKFEDILFRAYDFYLDKDGNLKIERNSTPLTLEETAFMVWNMEGRKTKKPLSNMMIINTERKALEKLRVGLARFGIKSLDDVFDPKYRTAATSKYGCTDSPE